MAKVRIRLSTAKINDPGLLILIKLWKHILNKLQEPVDLAEFIILRVDDRPVLRLDTKFHKERNRDPLFQDIPFLPIMGKSVRPCSL